MLEADLAEDAPLVWPDLLEGVLPFAEEGLLVDQEFSRVVLEVDHAFDERDLGLGVVPSHHLLHRGVQGF